MPSISTMLYPEPGYVRVEVNWADVTQATGIKVERVDCETGVRTPLRPYVCYDGDYLDASCGYGIFWDTEPPLDRCIYYCTTAQDGAGNVVTTASTPFVIDTFSRTVAAGSWGTADTGQAWTITQGTAANFSVTGTRGQVSVNAVNTPQRAVIDGPKLNAGLLVTSIPGTVATGSAIEMMALFRILAVTDDYRFTLQYTTTGTVNLTLQQVVASVGTLLASANAVALYTATTQIQLRAEVIGNVFRARAWDASGPEPTTWQINFTHATPALREGPFGLRQILNAGNTNPLPVVLQWDNLSIYDPCVSTVPVETCSDDLAVPSNGDFRLGDPVRPCNDVYLRLGEDVDPACVPTQGIFFANMSPAETFPAQTGTFLPTNSRYPIAVNRQRQAITATLTTVTRTFPDRDALRQLNDPGSPLLLRGPAQYGIDDRYMSVTDVTENRPLSDHRIPVRTVNMPHLEVARPSGPSTGVCGTRIKDLCDIYGSWSAMEAAGLTWADLLRGKASNATPVPDSAERTWNDVNATYASWNAVNAGNTDWDDLLDGA